jgi:hypothetical protein
MSHRARIIALLSVSTLLLASCGGGDSSGRTKNAALCYETQDDKDAAVKTAQERLEAAMSGASSGDDNDETPTSTIEGTSTTISQSTSTTILPSTSTTILPSTPTTILQKTSTSLEGASGGGYRHPAVRATSSGDTTVPPAGGGDALTPEQQQAQMELEAAEAQPVCEADGAVSDERTCDITLSVSGQFGGTSTCEEVAVEIVNTISTSSY